MNKRMIKAVFQAALWLLICASCKTASKHNSGFLGDFPAMEAGRVLGGTVKRTKNEIKPAEFTFVFYPRTNIVRMHHKFLGDNIWVNLSEENRKVIVESMEKYIEAYKTKTLSSKDDKKKAYFGKTKIKISWGFWGTARTAKPVLRCEFQLLTKSRPYFILGNATVNDEDGANCPAMRIAFSPAQCLDVIEILKQENLLKIVEQMNKQFERYGLDDEAGIEAGIENASRESSDENTVNYDDDF